MKDLSKMKAGRSSIVNFPARTYMKDAAALTHEQTALPQPPEPDNETLQGAQETAITMAESDNQQPV